MAVKSKKKKLVPRKPRPKKSKSGLVALAVLILLAAGLATLVLTLREVPVPSLAAQVAVTFGESGTGPGQLQSPRLDAVDAAGDVYVVDLGNSRINKYSPEGKFLLSWGKKGTNPPNAKPGEFDEPSGVAVDPSGDVLVADAWNGRIQKFDPDGKFLQEYAGTAYGFYSPRNVASDRQGNLLVADTGNSKVQIFSPAGLRLKTLGERGTSEGKFSEVFGVAVNSKGEIFAADPGNRRIHHYGPLPDARFLGDLKVPGWKRNAPFWPALAFDSADRLYAVDSGNRQIWVYDASLKPLGTVGGQPGHDYFASPVGLAMTRGDEMVVVDMGKSAVVKFKPLAFPLAH
jgi:DNA-binding beta-propeller fold protein YncE